jgi:tetratricopeptide (TPR) repeat protein
MIGATISHYRIVEKLGEGGMGVVYKALDTRLERMVALKFISSQSQTDIEQQRFVREARAAAQVHHPHICPIYEIGEAEGRLFFAMAFVEGSTVSRLISRGPLPVSEALGLMIQVLGGLDAAHRAGIVHRDIKSSNLIVDRGGNASILDFGLALRPQTGRITGTGYRTGTPSYMSPEQVRGENVDHRTDIWSAGVVLFEMLTGRLPFGRDSDISALYGIVNEPIPSPSSLRSGIAPAVEQVVGKALAKDPEERWQSAAQMAAELRRLCESRSDATMTLIGGTPEPATAAPAPATRPPSAATRRSYVRIAAIAALLVVILAGAFVAARRIWPPLPEQKQIAILPFEVVGSDETVRALADGLVETLTSKLTEFEEFQGKMMVVPASEIRTRKIASAEAARRIYGANLVITGSAQRWGEHIQFNLNLVDTAAMRQIAARTFEYDAARPIALRDEAINGAVSILRLKLSRNASGVVSAGETSSPAAYSDYLKASGYLARYDVRGNVDLALASLQTALQQDPNYALAWASMGEAYWRKAQLTSEKQWADRAVESARHAVDLDPNLASTHVKLGEILARNGRPQDAVQEERHALEMAPSNAAAYRALASAYTALKRYPEAETAYRKAVQLRPTDWFGYLLLGLFYHQRERYDEAKAAYRSALQLTPDNDVVLRNLAATAIREGQYGEAANLILRSIKFATSARTYGMLGLAYYYEGRFQEAASAMESANELDAAVYQTWGNLGTVYRHLPGSGAKARAAFGRAIELAGKALEVTPNDNNIHANLAEYHAKLGNRRQSLDEINRIPPADRQPYMARIALAYEIVGDRKHAIETVRTLLTKSTDLNEIKNDADLTGLWNDPSFQASIRK